MMKVYSSVFLEKCLLLITDTPDAYVKVNGYRNCNNELIINNTQSSRENMKERTIKIVITGLIGVNIIAACSS